jgi:hypothetical protein
MEGGGPESNERVFAGGSAGKVALNKLEMKRMDALIGPRRI